MKLSQFSNKKPTSMNIPLKTIDFAVDINSTKMNKPAPPTLLVANKELLGE